MFSALYADDAETAEAVSDNVIPQAGPPLLARVDVAQEVREEDEPAVARDSRGRRKPKSMKMKSLRIKTQMAKSRAAKMNAKANRAFEALCPCREEMCCRVAFGEHKDSLETLVLVDGSAIAERKGGNNTDAGNLAYLNRGLCSHAEKQSSGILAMCSRPDT